MSGSSARPIRWMKPRPQKAAITPVIGRPQRAAPVVEVHPAQHPLDAVGDHEDEEHVAGVVVDPAVEARLAGDVDLGVGILERVDDVVVHLVEDALVVELALDEVGADERRLVVERDQQAVDVLRVVDVAPDEVRLVLRLDLAGHDRLGAHGAAGGDLEVAHGAVRDRVDLVVVDAVDLVEALGHLPDLVQGLGREDRAVLHLEHDHDVVGAAEGAREAVVDLDVLVVLRQQVAEAGHQAELEAPVGEQCGDEDDDDRDRMAVLDQLVAEPVENALVFGDLVVEGHDSSFTGRGATHPSIWQPGLSAVRGVQDVAEAADDPAVVLVEEVDAAQPGVDLAAERHAQPRLAGGALAHDHAGRADGPARWCRGT